MRVRNKDLYLKWKGINRRESYGLDIFEFAEKWANAMEDEIKNGKDIPEIAEDLANEVGRKSISNTMFDAVLEVLGKCWIYGNDLLRFYNKKKRDFIGEEV